MGCSSKLYIPLLSLSHLRISHSFIRKSAVYTARMPSHRQALLLSSSNCEGYTILTFAKKEITAFLQKNNVKELIFVPYAQNDFDGYTNKIKQVIDPWGFNVTGLHTYPDPVSAIHFARAIFVGGGNTFLLLKRLYEADLVSVIKKRVDDGCLLYIGSSAGTNVATRSIQTTNDMPVIYPPTFNAISIIPFNINPHYIDPVENDKHKGETRDQRIQEYLQMYPYAPPVLGLREGSILYVCQHQLIIKGVAGAVLFNRDSKKIELEVGQDVSFLCQLLE